MTFTKCLILEIRHALSITHSVPFILQGNLNWMRSREATIQSPVWRGRENEIRPFGDPKASDSANLDNAAEVRDSAPFINYTKHAFLCSCLRSRTIPMILLSCQYLNIPRPFGL
jgi:hypothetical protein